MKNQKRTILIDLDGVLNSYIGEFDENFIPPVLEGAKDFLKNLSEDFRIKIFTTRNKLLSAKWLIENNLDQYIIDITDKKDLCWLYIDDRCLQFKGDYKELFENIKMFKPWYKQTK